jgi:hypothetical protein
MLAEALDVLVDDFAGHLVENTLVVGVLAFVDPAEEMRRVPTVSVHGVTGAKLEAPGLARLSASDAKHGHSLEGTDPAQRLKRLVSRGYQSTG